MKPVYSIIFMESSPSEFHSDLHPYLFRISQKSDPLVDIELLQNYIFIPLDNFQKSIQNKDKSKLSRLDAWLLFLSSDDPEDIMILMENYPEFRPMYNHMFSLCLKEERMMEMFSEELRMMDNNTVKLMIDELKDNLEKAIAEKDQAIAEKDQAISEKDQAISEKDQAISEKDQVIAEKDKTILEMQKEMDEMQQALEKKLAEQ